MLNFISKIFGGNKHQRDLKDLLPIVDEVNEFYEELQAKCQEMLAYR